MKVQGFYIEAPGAKTGRHAYRRQVYINGIFCESLAAGSRLASQILGRAVDLYQVYRAINGLYTIPGIEVTRDGRSDFLFFAAEEADDDSDLADLVPVYRPRQKQQEHKPGKPLMRGIRQVRTILAGDCRNRSIETSGKTELPKKFGGCYLMYLENGGGVGTFL